jgi:threonine dehydratase
MRALGVTLVEHGDDFQEAREHALRWPQERGAHMVPSFHPDLLRGVATYWWEFFGRAATRCGLCAHRPGLGRLLGHCRQAGAGPRRAHRGRGQPPRHHLCRLARRRPVVEAPVTTQLADGMACRVADQAALDMLHPAPGPCGAGQRRRSGRRHARPVHRHPQRRRRRRRRRPGRRAAGARILRGQCVGLALTGGNVDAPVFSEVLSL